MQDEVKVSQADREAAAALIEAQYERQGIPKGRLQTPDETRIGDRDHCVEVQAFAKFEQSIRHQAERETLARMEPVAWMYVRKIDAWPTAPNILSNERWPANDPARPFWNELALYTLPPSPEAGQ